MAAADWVEVADGEAVSGLAGVVVVEGAEYVGVVVAAAGAGDGVESGDAVVVADGALWKAAVVDGVDAGLVVGTVWGACVSAVGKDWPAWGEACSAPVMACNCWSSWDNVVGSGVSVAGAPMTARRALMVSASRVVFGSCSFKRVSSCSGVMLLTVVLARSVRFS